jgi:ATP-dependent DNA helicase RecQ
VYRLKERNRSFGKTMIIDILRGSKNEKIKRFGLENLSVWGIMADEKAHRIRAILDFLIEKGCLLTEGDEYPVLTLGDGIEEILREERRLYMKLPKEQESVAQRELPVKPAAPRKTANTHTQATADFEGIVDMVLFEKLKELRRKFATEESVPAYIVFSDASLRDMCRKKPASLIQFSAVNGVGAVKLEKYGEAFVAAINNSAD